MCCYAERAGTKACKVKSRLLQYDVSSEAVMQLYPGWPHAKHAVLTWACAEKASLRPLLLSVHSLTGGFQHGERISRI